MKTKLKKRDGGFTLIDIMAALLLISIIMTAGLDVHSMVRKFRLQQEEMSKAISLAASEIEDLKYTARISPSGMQIAATVYIDPYTHQRITLDDHQVVSRVIPITDTESYTLSYALYDNHSIPNGWSISYRVTPLVYYYYDTMISDDYNWNLKEIVATCHYGQNGERSISLTGFIYREGP